MNRAWSDILMLDHSEPECSYKMTTYDHESIFLRYRLYMFIFCFKKCIIV